jgi:hypothetical protein
LKIIVTFLSGALLLSLTAGCGGGNAGQQKSTDSKQKAQGQQQTPAKPIDSALKDQMNMYKNIKQYEYDEAEKLRKANKAQLKKMQKDLSNRASQKDTSTNKPGQMKKQEKDKKKADNKSDKNSQDGKK